MNDTIICIIISNISEYMLYILNQIFADEFLEDYRARIDRELNFIIKLGINVYSKEYFIYKSRNINLPQGLQKVIKYKGKKYYSSELVNEIMDRLIKIETEKLNNNQ